MAFACFEVARWPKSRRGRSYHDPNPCESGNTTMTHCTATALPFASAKRRTIAADFSGGVLTSDAGALLLREADRQLGLIDALDRAIPDPRHPELIAHPPGALTAH